MEASLLFVHAGDDHARRSVQENGHGYWSAALPLVLEKHGYLDFDVAEAAAVTDSASLAGRAGVLVAALPDRHWSAPLLRLLEEQPCPVLLESPVPERVRDRLGVSACEAIGRTGRFGVRGDLGARVIARGGTRGSRVAERRVSTVHADPTMHWAAVAGDLISPTLVSAWRVPAWEAFAWTLSTKIPSDGYWRAEGDDPRPAIARAGDATALSFGLFAYLGQAHTVEPWDHGEVRAGGDTGMLELLLLELIDEMHARAGRTRARVLPWPAPHTWALSVRHDFDRELAPSEVQERLRRHDGAGTAATWYWRARHLQHPDAPLRHARRSTILHDQLDHPEPESGRWPAREAADAAAGNLALRAVAAAPRHEVGLHTEMAWVGAGDERRLVEAVSGARIQGACAHGDPWCFRFQGAPSLLWADRHGLLYTENLQFLHRHPQRVAALLPDGAIRPLGVLGMPKHASLDKRLTSPDTWAAKVIEAGPAWQAAGGLMQLMNHPDINQDALFDVISKLPEEGRWNVTAGEAAAWWAATHVPDRARLRVTPDGTAHFESDEPVEGVQIELRAPDGSVSVV